VKVDGQWKIAGETVLAAPRSLKTTDTAGPHASPGRAGCTCRPACQGIGAVRHAAAAEPARHSRTHHPASVEA
jgi:hypothetical protein